MSGKIKDFLPPSLRLSILYLNFKTSPVDVVKHRLKDLCLRGRGRAILRVEAGVNDAIHVQVEVVKLESVWVWARGVCGDEDAVDVDFLGLLDAVLDDERVPELQFGGLWARVQEEVEVEKSEGRRRQRRRRAVPFASRPLFTSRGLTVGSASGRRRGRPSLRVTPDAIVRSGGYEKTSEWMFNAGGLANVQSLLFVLLLFLLFLSLAACYLLGSRSCESTRAATTTHTERTKNSWRENGKEALSRERADFLALRSRCKENK